MTKRPRPYVVVPVAVGLALVVLVLPPRPLPERVGLVSSLIGFQGGSRAYAPDGGGLDRYDRSVSAASVRIRERIAASSHGALDVAASRGGRARRSEVVPLTMVVDPGVPPAAARAWFESAERQLRNLPEVRGAGSRVILGLHMRHPVEPRMRGAFTEIGRFQYNNGADSACIVDVFFGESAGRGLDRFAIPSRQRGDVLGRCALYGRLGFPGAGARGWSGLEGSWSFGGSGLSVALSLQRRGLARDTLPWGSGWFGETPWQSIACLRGNDEQCARLAGFGGRRLRDDYWWWYSWNRVDARLVVTSLLLGADRERLRTFWSSPARADSALAAAYGVHSGVLVRDAFAKRFVPPLRRRVALGRLAVSILWLAGLAGLAAFLSGRREMA